MKKILLSLVALLTMGAANVMAETTTIGAEDNSSLFWTAFSDYYTVNEGKKAHITFTNYSDQVTNYDNYIFVANTAGTVRSGAGYAEYLVLRADNYGWGNNYNGDANSSAWDWNTFKADMNGANVAIDVYNKCGFIYFEAVITTTANKVYKYATATTNTGAKDFGFYFTVEKAHLSNFTVTTEDLATPVTIGAEDNSADWWTAFSDYYVLQSGKNAHVTFKNYSDKAKTFHNWILGIIPQGTTRNSASYTEYSILRADNYGWGSCADVESFKNNFNWDTFLAEIDGTDVEMDIYNNAGTIYGVAEYTPAGAETPYTYIFDTKATGADDLAFFFTVEKAHLSNFTATISDPATKPAITGTYSLDANIEGTRGSKQFAAQSVTVADSKIAGYVDVTLPAATWNSHNMTESTITFVKAVENGTQYNLVGMGYVTVDGTQYCGTIQKGSYISKDKTQANIVVKCASGSDSMTVTYTIYNPTALKNVEAASKAANGKFAKNGQIVILKNGKQYNAVGAQMK